MDITNPVSALSKPFFVIQSNHVYYYGGGDDGGDEKILYGVLHYFITVLQIESTFEIGHFCSVIKLTPIVTIKYCHFKTQTVSSSELYYQK